MLRTCNSMIGHCRKWDVAKPSLDWWINVKGRDPIAGLEHYISLHA